MTQKITKEAIFAAADQLTQEGAQPTLVNVRKALGDRGSNTTYTEAMREWRSLQSEANQKQSEPAPEAITQELTKLGGLIWATAQEIANTRLDNERKALEQTRAEIEGSQVEVLELADHLSAELEQAKDEIIKLSAEVSDRGYQLEKVRIQNTSLSAELGKLNAQADANNQRISDLKKEQERLIDQLEASSRDHKQELKEQGDLLTKARSEASDNRSHASLLMGELEALKSKVSDSENQVKLSKEELSNQAKEFDKRLAEVHKTAKEELSNQAKEFDKRLAEVHKTKADAEKLAASLEGELKATKAQQQPSHTKKPRN